MSTIHRLDAMRASLASPPRRQSEAEEVGGGSLTFGELEAEMNRLSAINAELMSGLHDEEPSTEAGEDPTPSLVSLELEILRMENAEFKARIEELEAAAANNESWSEQQREYEMLLEEKSEIIRSLHLRMQEMQESVNFADNVPPPSPGNSSIGVGQAEEILRLKRELEEQRRQIEQDENDMMVQMRQMEMQMAKERAEMARHRQEIQRLQADLAREIEQTSRNPELRERLHSLRRPQETKAATPITAAGGTKPDQKSSGFLRRIFG
jgi:myosin heavy subunit